MRTLLVLNDSILAVDPVDAGDAWATPCQIIPKHVAGGAQIVDVDHTFDHPLHWYRYEDGAVILAPPVEPSPPVPDSVSMRQARLALLGAGLLAQVDAAIAAMPDVAGAAARIEWEYATEVRRDSTLVAGMAAALSLTDAQLDQLFVAAAGL